MSDIMKGYQYKTPVRGSLYNRFNVSKKTILIVLVAIALVVSALVAYFVIPEYIINYREAHRFDHVADEKATITQVVISQLSNIPYNIDDLPAKIELLEVGNGKISVWTENLCYYGPLKGFSPFDIEFRDSVFE